MSMKNSSDTIGNRTRDLLACGAVPQPTAPLRTPTENIVLHKNDAICMLGNQGKNTDTHSEYY